MAFKFGRPGQSFSLAPSYGGFNVGQPPKPDENQPMAPAGVSGAPVGQTFQTPEFPGGANAESGSGTVSGAGGFGPDATIGNISQQAATGPAGTGPMGNIASGLMGGMGTGMFGSALNAGAQMAGRVGAGFSGVPGLPGMDFFGLNQALSDPEMANAILSTISMQAPSGIAPQAISSAAGRGINGGSQAGGQGLTGFEGMPGVNSVAREDEPAPPSAAPAGVAPTTDAAPTGMSADAGTTGELKKGGKINKGSTRPGADDVPVKLSRGEFVEPKGAVDQFGPQLEAMRKVGNAGSGGFSVGPRR